MLLQLDAGFASSIKVSTNKLYFKQLESIGLRWLTFSSTHRRSFKSLQPTTNQRLDIDSWHTVL